MTQENYTNKFRYYVWLKWCYARCLRTIQSYRAMLSPDLNADTHSRLWCAIHTSEREAQAFQTKYRLLPSRA
jgi:hypothetical protein